MVGSGYVLIIVAVILGWETIKTPVLVRAPQQAAFLAVNSPEALGLVAEKQFEAERYEDAGVLAQESLRKAPFNARALRVLGLVRAKEAARLSEADQIVTLAGNWSLRDDPAHAWLIERRLRQGSFASAFAHADTLARRREDLQPGVFQLFTQAATLDHRSLPSLAARLALRPPWRGKYLESLRRDPNGDAVMFYLASSLAGKPGAFRRTELEVLYKHWLGEGRIEAIREIRRKTAPEATNALANGDFETEYAEQPLPFGWELASGVRLSSQILPDDIRPAQKALRVQVSGDRLNIVLDQFLLLSPGAYRITGNYRVEQGEITNRAEWTVRCVENPAPLDVRPARTLSTRAAWTPFAVTVRIPANGCTGQRLQLWVRGVEYRSDLAFWIDDVRVTAIAGD